MNTKEWLKQFNEASDERRLTGSNEAAMRLRGLQKHIFEQTMNIVNRGSYTAEDGTLVTLPDWKEMYQNSVLYSQPITLDQQALPAYKTEVRVESIDCLIAGRNLQLEGLNPVVLNMASSMNPGGGVIGGAGAQEENLFRRSNLFKSMFQYARYAEEYGLKLSSDQYPLDRNHGGVYTPNAVVFRGTQAAGYPLLKEPHILSFVAVAGISHPRLIKDKLAPEEVTVTKNKIRTIFRIALKHGHDSIVLGALGCGAFCNPPAHIAKIFHEVIKEAEFRNHFKVLLFAILEDHNSRRRHNPEGNFIPFKREFENFTKEEIIESIQKDMEFKKIKVTAVNLEVKKSVTITADMQKISKCPTQDAVKKALEKQILESKVFSKADLPQLKYQGRKDVLEEWKAIRPAIAEQEEREKAEEQQAQEQMAKEYHSNYDLDRFITAQEYSYPIALEEIHRGRKTGHWIWYIFPQQKGLGHSYNSEYYGLDGLDEAIAYVQHPILGKRLREICQALLENRGKDIGYIMGSSIDVIKLKTSMELFDLASPNDIFNKVLRTFF